MNKKFKKLTRQIHLWLGLTSGLIVFIVSITGFLYVFEEDIRDFSQQKYLQVPLEQKQFIGLKQIVLNFEHLAPKQKITGIKINLEEPNGTVQVSTKKKQVYYFNPYNGDLVNKGHADWLNVVLEIHTSLLLGDTGKLIQGWAVVIFLVMLITGLILWFPAQARLLKQSLTIKWKASFKRVSYDLHQVLGFYASIFLITIALTGTYFAFSASKAMVGFLTGSRLNEGNKVQVSTPPVKDKPAVMYDKIYQSLVAKYPGANSASFSVRKNGELRLRMIYPYKWSRNQNTFFFDASTGSMTRSKLYKDNNAADTFEATNYDLHTGRLFGIAGKILWSLVSLVSASLPVTGFIIWWKKRKKSPKR
jgi:uncharacterized iron-regulated membrane protein